MAATRRRILGWTVAWLAAIVFFGSGCIQLEAKPVSNDGNLNEHDVNDAHAGFGDHVDYPTDALREGMIGTVHHFVDGDTLELAVRGVYFDIRFEGMSAPECQKKKNEKGRYRCVADDEYYGLASYKALLDIVGSRPLRVDCGGDQKAGEPCEQDHYDRWLANLVRSDGLDVSEELIRRGAGFTSTGFSSDTRARYCRAEYDARKHARGMWKGKTVQQTLSKMSETTQRWYQDHDERCGKAIGTL